MSLTPLDPCLFYELVSSQALIPPAQKRLELHFSFASDQGCGQRVQDGLPCNRLQKLKVPAPKADGGRWQSLGGHFDYSDWVDRDRFVELDKAISSIVQLATSGEEDILGEVNEDRLVDASYGGHLKGLDGAGRIEQ